jgi:hypothetical protein
MARRRLVTILGALVALAWLVPAALVTFYDPRAPAGPLLLDNARPGGPVRSFFGHGYAIGGGSDSWEEGGPHFKVGWRARRGPLDRQAATFPLGVRYAVEEGGRLRAIRLLVTRDSSYAFPHDDREWTEVARADAVDNAAQCEGVVPADSTAFRVVVLLEGEAEPTGFSHSMPTAETFLGRVYDEIAYLPAFAWLPELR